MAHLSEAYPPHQDQPADQCPNATDGRKVKNYQPPSFGLQMFNVGPGFSPASLEKCAG